MFWRERRRCERYRRGGLEILHNDIRSVPRLHDMVGYIPLFLDTSSNNSS